MGGWAGKTAAAAGRRCHRAGSIVIIGGGRLKLTCNELPALEHVSTSSHFFLDRRKKRNLDLRCITYLLLALLPLVVGVAPRLRRLLLVLVHRLRRNLLVHLRCACLVYICISVYVYLFIYVCIYMYQTSTYIYRYI